MAAAAVQADKLLKSSNLLKADPADMAAVAEAAVMEVKYFILQISLNVHQKLYPYSQAVAGPAAAAVAAADGNHWHNN
jgi:hypothetical protein